MYCSRGEDAESYDATSKHQMAVEPMTEKTLNVPTSPSRKRKRPNGQYEEEAGAAFTLKAYPPKSGNKAVDLISKLLLDRSHLPLSYLDISGNPGEDELSGTKLFVGHLADLEYWSTRTNASDTPKLLIAQLKGGKRIYAIERVQLKVYALCRLDNRVTVERLEALRPPRRCAEIPRLQPAVSQDDPWWKMAAVVQRGQITSFQDDGTRDGLAKELRLVVKRESEGYATTDAVDKACETQHALNTAPTRDIITTVSDPAVEPAGQLSTEAMLAMIRTHYLDALYISKTPLAYFAKGPLSRARAALLTNGSSSSHPSDYIQGLKSNVLSLAMLDKKYRESLPSIVQQMPTSRNSEDNLPMPTQNDERFLKSRKRKKVGRDGLFPGEEKNVSKWWMRTGDVRNNGGPEMSRDEERTHLLGEQRVRETKLQMILVLEVLALEAIPTGKSKNQHEGSTLDHAPESDDLKRKRAKKAQDLNVLLDLSIDRLCIWHSMAVEEKGDSGKVKISAQSVKTAAHDGSTDALRDFCSEVIIPFYSSRLPDLASSVCQKLGWSGGPSPSRHALPKTISKSRQLARPGDGVSVNRQKSRRTLARVLTDEKVAARRPTKGLSRSNTDPILRFAKRETSDLSVANNPQSKAKSTLSRSYSQREVDLAAVSQAAEAKIQRKAHLEQELKGAIATLKKPNPRQAVMEFVESTEKRATSTSSRSRKSQNPVHNRLGRNVQVFATPKGNRHRDVYDNLPPLPRPSRGIMGGPDIVPPSSDPRVPASSSRPQSTREASVWLDPSSKPESRNPGVPIEQTPTKKRSKTMNDSLYTPIKRNRSDLAMIDTPLIKSTPRAEGETNTRQSAIEVRDTKSDGVQAPCDWELAGNMPMMKITHPLMITSPAVESEHQSIYETLGWDDDEVDLLM